MFSLTVVDHVRLDSEHVAQNYTVHARSAERIVRIVFALRLVIAALLTAATCTAIGSVMTGGRGRDEMLEFYGRHFIPQMPADTTLRLLSRTVGQNRVIDELIVSFTHDREMRSFFPAWRRPVARLCYRMWW